MHARSAVGPRIIRNIPFLKRLGRCTSVRKRIRLVHNASEDELLSLVEISLNILKGNFSLTQRQMNKLLAYVDEVRKLSRSRSPRKAREIVQKGGNMFLASLIAPVLLEAGRYLLNGEKIRPSA